MSKRMAIAKRQTKVVLFQPRKKARLRGWLEGERRGWGGVALGGGGGTYLGVKIRSVIHIAVSKEAES
jgi:hypothetical protein